MSGVWGAKESGTYNRRMPMVRGIVARLVIALMLVVGLVDLVTYSGIIKSEDALSTEAFRGVPGGTAANGGSGAQAAARAEQDAGDGLPGRYVPPQGRQHLQSPLRARVPFCKPDAISNTCYASNPPTSGLHLPVQQHVVLSDGNEIAIPPAPDIYDFAIPREAIPHLEEHAGVYVGYNCEDGCGGALERAKSVVSQELSLGERVVMSPDPDLDRGVIAAVSWTRIDSFAVADYNDGRLRAFIKAHSCRFDPEGLCKQTPVN